MPDYLQHVVKRGDTLGKLARINSVTVRELVSLNAIADPDHIEVGQTLKIRQLPGDRPASLDRRYTAANLKLPAANETYRNCIIDASRQTDLAPQAIAAIIDAEAARIAATGQWNAGSRAATSSAAGLTQFIAGTWRGEACRGGGLLNTVARRAGLVDDQGRVTDDAGLLSLRFDPRIAILAGADYAAGNLAILRNAGVLPATLDPAAAAKLAYLAHREGPGRAARFLRGEMGYVTPAIFAANVPGALRRKVLGDAANGNIGQAYRNWFASYVDGKIDVTRFMTDDTGVVIAKLSRFFL